MLTLESSEFFEFMRQSAAFTHITLVCMAVDGIYATSMSDIAGVIAWADGGAAD